MRISLLGTPHVVINDETIDSFISDKARALLYYVACQPAAVARERLLLLLWEAFERKKGLQNLRVTLNNLKKLLGDHIAVTRTDVSLRDVWVDVRDFERRLADWEWEEATTLYTGELCTGFGVADAVAFETWLLLERERLGQLAVEALTRLVRTARDSADLTQSLKHSRHLAQLDPLNEAHQRQLIELLARMGQYAAALQQGEQLRLLLDEELGVPLEEETEQLLRVVQRARLQPRPSLEPASPLFGRSHDQQTLISLLSPVRRKREKFVTLVGLGGVGKTRLAQAVGTALQTHFFNGVVFVPLAAIAHLSGVVSAIAQAIQLAPKGNASLTSQLTVALAEREMLLILDNCEQLNTTTVANWLQNLLRSARRCAVLATSRVALGGEMEHVYTLGGLADSADHLFIQSVRQLHHAYTPTEQERPAIARIVVLTDGLPLAVQLAAAQTDFYTVAQIADEITADLDTLTTQQRDVPRRQRTIRAVLAYAWRQLSAELQQIVIALSVMRDPFSAAAAHAIAAATPHHLAQLQRTTILRQHDDTFSIHELVRQFSAEQGDPAHVAHATYFANWVATHENAIVCGQPATLEAYAQQQNDIAAAWDWAISQRDEAQITQLLRGFADYHILRNMRESLWDALQAARVVVTDPALLGRIQLHRAAIKHIAGDVAEARPLIENALELLHDQPRWLAYALTRAAAIETDEGQTEHAAAMLAQALAHFRERGDRIGEARTLIDIGLSRSRMGETEIGWIEEALAIAESAEDWRTQLKCNIVLGNGCIGRGEYAQAVGYYDSAETIAARLTDRRNQASCTVNRAYALQLLGQLPDAAIANQHAYNLFEQISDRDGICFALKNLGSIAYEQGEYAAAERHLRHALALRRTMSGRLQGWLELYQLGLVLFARGKSAAATQAIITIVRRLVDADYEQAILYSTPGIAQMLLVNGHTDLAADLLACAIAHPSMEAKQRERCVQMLATIGVNGDEDASFGEIVDEVIGRMAMYA